MVTEEIRFFLDNILNTGNMLGLDRPTMEVYLMEGIKMDDDSNVLLFIDSYTMLGGFLEALIDKMVSEYGEKSNAEWIIKQYSDFTKNIKKYESNIVKNTKLYFEKINNIADVLRKAEMKVKVHLSEISSGVELYLSGRSEVLRNHISRKINDLSSEGIEKIIIISPFEQVLLEKRYIPQAAAWPFDLQYFVDTIKERITNIASPKNINIMLYEPYLTPLLMFKADLKEATLDFLSKTISLIKSIDGVNIIEEKYDGAPIGYEQIWMINPIVAVGLARNILRKYEDKVNAIVTIRTSTAIILRRAKVLSGSKIEVYDYADFVSRIILGREI
ncbi:MAG: hypothetical protein Q6363_009705 [Candidatus Njordarchaeota archaeon]